MSDQATVEYVVRVHDGEDGSLWAEVLDLPGCFASGGSLDELREALEEAISLCVSDAPRGSAGRIGPALRVGEMRVRVAA